LDEDLLDLKEQVDNSTDGMTSDIVLSASSLRYRYLFKDTGQADEGVGMELGETIGILTKFEL
jgi:hypothetical protein